MNAVAYVQDFLSQSTMSLYQAILGLLAPALFFFVIGLLVKRSALFDDMRGAIRESGLNFSIMVFNIILVVPGLVLLGQGIHDLAAFTGLPVLAAGVWDAFHPFVIIFIAVFIGDFVSYWRHRLEHTPILWPSHAVHHSDTEMTWLTLERFHPINRLTTYVIDSFALLALGFPPYAIVANNLVRHYYGYLIHADLPWTYGRAAYVFVSPAMHRWHHAADPRAFNTNFATVFSVFDRFFSTYRVPGVCDVPLGVTDKMKPTLVGQISYAFTPRAYATQFRHWRNAKKR